MILQKICYSRNEICDSDNITAVITTEPTTKHMDPLYVIEMGVSFLFSSVATCSTSSLLIKMWELFKWLIENDLQSMIR